MSANRLGDLLLHWEELREQGRTVTPEDLCRDAGAPELRDELRRRIQALQAMNPALDTAGGPPTVDAALPGAPTLWPSTLPPCDTTAIPRLPPGELAAPPGYKLLGELGRG